MRLAALCLFLLAAPAWADEAQDAVYEAADAIDAARAEFEAGRDDAAADLLARATKSLDEAARLDPELPRVAFERARIALLLKAPERARTLLMPALRGELEGAEHVRMAALLDEALRAAGRPSLGAQWTRAGQLRDGGGALMAAGAGVAGAGVAMALVAFGNARDHGVSDGNTQANRAGWGLVAGGGAALAAGAGLVTAGGVWQAQLQAVLPGPWRLPQAHGERPAWLGFQLRGPLPAPRLARR